VDKKNQTPPVLMVSGTAGFLRRRFLWNVITKRRTEGWRVEFLDGEDHAGILRALDGNPFLSEQILAVVEQPEKAPLALIERHMQVKDPSTVLFLHVDGDLDGRTKFSKLAKALGTFHVSFADPPSYKAVEVAERFVQEEVERLGLMMDTGLVSALVAKVGSDLGFLRFEVLKIALSAEASGVTTVTPETVRGTMAQILGADVLPITDALVARNTSKLYRLLQQVRKTSKDDPTMRICGFLTAHLQRWMQAAHLEGLSVKEAAQQIGQNPWAFEKSTLPGARVWGRKGTIWLLRTISDAERAVLSGALNPWYVLVSGLLRACREGPR
jgi:DNA polymerase III delta subunit